MDNDHMLMPLYVENRDVNEAQELMNEFGLEAGLEAAERAENSRNIGNHIQFARWRQIERLIMTLSLKTVAGTVH